MNKDRLAKLVEAGAKLARKGGALEGSELRAVTVLTARLRGADGLLEASDARAALKQLNEMFAAIEEPVSAHKGTLDDLTEEGFRVVFGAPMATERHAEQAVRAAQAIRSAVASVFERWRGGGTVVDGLAIGIASGAAASGMLGGPRRVSYTVFGAPVRAAAALCAAAKAGEILVATVTRDASGESGPWEATPGDVRPAAFRLLPATR